MASGTSNPTFYGPGASSTNTPASTVEFKDVGTPPNYRPAPNHTKVDFRSRNHADPASSSHGFPVPLFFEAGFDKLMEAPDDTPLALTPVGQDGTITVDFHWPGYDHYPVKVTIKWGGTEYISRSDLGKDIVKHVNHYFDMTDPVIMMPPPIPIGRFEPGVTSTDLLLRSLDPVINPEGRVVWVPRFVVRYPLSNRHLIRRNVRPMRR